MTYNEANYENSVFELFKNMGYEHVFGSNIERDFYSPFYEDELIVLTIELTEKLQKNNKLVTQRIF